MNLMKIVRKLKYLIIMTQIDRIQQCKKVTQQIWKVIRIKFHQKIMSESGFKYKEMKISMKISIKLLR